MLSRLSRLWWHLKVRLGQRFAGSDRFEVETTELRDVLLDFEHASQRPDTR